jgi:hypothetical protein
MINRFKQKANYPYNISSTTLTGMNWGGPTPGVTPQDPSSCDEHKRFISTPTQLS